MRFRIDNVGALQVFQVMRQGSAILISIFLAKSQLSTDEIGIYEMLLYLGTTVSFFWIAGLSQGLLTHFPDLPQNNKKKLIFNAFLLYSLLSFFVFLFLIFFEKKITLLLVGQAELPFYRLYAIYLLLFLPTFLIEYFYLLHDRPYQIVQFGVAVFTLQILVVVVPIFLGWGLLWSFYGLIALAVVRYLWLLRTLLLFSKINFQIPIFKKYIGLSIPLILYALLSGFPVVFDNWLVGWFYNDKSIFAIFRYGARELPLAIALSSALSAAMIPEIVKNQSASLTILSQKSLRLYHLIFPLSILLMATSWWWFPKVFNNSFAESAAIFNVLLLVVISRLLFPQTILIALKETKVLLFISITETLLNIVLSFWWVSEYGLVGITFGTVIAFLFEKIMIAIFIFWKYQIKIQQYTPINWLVGYSLVLIAIYFFSF